MKLIEETKWIIMSKDRKVVAKGTPRNRELVEVEDLESDGKRFLTYTTKGKAESAFRISGFFQWGTRKRYKAEDLEAVKVKITIYDIGG